MYVEINTVLNNQWVKKEIEEEIRNVSFFFFLEMYLETNENILYKNVWDTEITVLRGALIAKSACI